MDRERSNRRKVYGLALLLVVSALALKGVSDSDLFAASRQYEGELAKARQLGLTVSLAEYKRPSVPDEQNAATLYRKAIERMEGEDKAAFEYVAKAWKTKSNELPPSELDAHLAMAAPVLDMVDQASRRPYLDFQRDYRQGFNVDYSEFGPLSHILGALRLDGQRQIDKGDIAGGIARARTMARLSNHVGQENVIIAAMIQASFIDRTFDFLSQLIQDAGKDPAVRQGVRQAVLDMGSTPDTRKVIELELPSQLDAIDRIAASEDVINTEQSEGKNMAVRLARFGVAKNAFKMRTLEYWRLIHERLPEDPGRYMDAYHAFRDLDEEYDHSGHSHDGHDHADRSGPSYMMLQYLRPVFSGASVSMARSETKKRLLIAAVDAIEGKNDLPIDPFSQKPLIRKGKLIYSVNENQKDDGGSTKKSNTPQPLDLVIQLP